MRLFVLTMGVLLSRQMPLAASTVETPIQWHEIDSHDVEGQGWTDVQSPFDRLPARAESLVRPQVWALARHSSGINVCFTTDATAIHVRWTVTSDRIAMSHMPATGVSGVDLYVRYGDQWRFASTARPGKTLHNELLLISRAERRAKQYRLYFPLYNGVSELAIGVDQGASFSINNPRSDRPVVFYGTSITQGGCASRPGMSFTAILGRRLNVPVLNLGFSGNGKTEPELAQLIAELQPSVVVLDPLGNLHPKNVSDRLPTFIQIIRERHPRVPILLNENVTYPTAAIDADKRRRVEDSNRRLHDILHARMAAGDRWIAIVPTCDLTVDGGESTVDGVHPTDLGMVRMADALELSLRRALMRQDEELPN
ncbi:MAG TPA: SGNH/GDSL hydrolase family protein [Lacipirellulaceae bacterium]|nr:SGNH/GDSL hydrolase family protein [Lacipirellulaceae bacterium]